MIFNRKCFYNSRHITLIVWGVPWGRKIAPSSSLWAGGSFWEYAPRHPNQKGLSRFSHPEVFEELVILERLNK